VHAVIGTAPPAERELIDGLRVALDALPDVSVVGLDETDHVPAPGARVDAVLDMRALGRPARLLVEAKSQGYPRDLLSAVHQLRHYTSLARDPSPSPMIVANALSPGSRELLRREGIGYWDRSGSLYLKLPWALFYVDRPQPPAAMRQLRSLYRGSAAQVVHALLTEPARPWHVQELAARAEVSVSRAHAVLTQLEQHLWVEKRGKGPAAVRALVDPGALLDSWADVHSLQEYAVRPYYGWSQSPLSLRSTLAGVLERHQIPYALTLASGAELIAPFITGNARMTALAQDHPALGQATEEAGLAPVEDGENVALLVTRQRAPLLFRQAIDSLQVASTVQLYVDLWASPGRGKEQARHLRAERLPY